MTDAPNCPECGRPVSVTDGIKCYECHFCRRLWPASYLDREGRREPRGKESELTTTTSQTVVLQELIAQATRDLGEIADHVTLADAFTVWDVEHVADVTARAVRKVRWLREQTATGLFG